MQGGLAFGAGSNGDIKALQLDANSNLKVSLADSSIQIPVDIQGSTLKATQATLFNALAIRATGNNFAPNLDWSGYSKVALRVTSTLDQPVDLILQVQNTGDYSDLSGNPIKVTIPANPGGSKMILLNENNFASLKGPFPEPVALKATCNTAPTTGTLTVIAYYLPIS